MIFSMTGFGKGETALPQKHITIEIKALNSKTADVSLRMPAIYRDYEHHMRTQVIKKLKRGKIDVFINEEYINDVSDVTINTSVLENYLMQLLPFTEKNKVAVDSTMVGTLLTLPHTIQSQKTVLSEADAKQFLETFETALDKVVEFRRKEGLALEDDLLRNKRQIADLLNQVPQYETARITRIEERLKEALEKMKTAYDENRFEQELIFYLEKLDVSEEKQRLQTHLNYFEETIKADVQEKGKKLGFITQEMGREINTLGSKANDSDLQRLVVEMKDALEKIKEQVANVL
jgi:uncharacterized protein (TIGR00255 family)